MLEIKIPASRSSLVLHFLSSCSFASSSALIYHKVVIFINLLFDHTRDIPVASMTTTGNAKDNCHSGTEWERGGLKIVELF